MSDAELEALGRKYAVERNIEPIYIDNRIHDPSPDEPEIWVWHTEKLPESFHVQICDVSTTEAEAYYRLGVEVRDSALIGIAHPYIDKSSLSQKSI